MFVAGKHPVGLAVKPIQRVDLTSPDATGRHVMIMNAGDMMSGYPEEPTPDTTMPYVMWAGTPYAHLMIPVK